MRVHLFVFVFGAVRRTKHLEVGTTGDLNSKESEAKLPDWLNRMFNRQPADVQPATIGTVQYHNAETSQDLTAVVHYPEAGAGELLPLYVRFAGTDEPPSPIGAAAGQVVSLADHAELAGMAGRGYVSAMVEYPDDDACFRCALDGSCTVDEAKAACIASMTQRARDAKAALDALCSDPRVDCARGVAVSGFSQGSQVAMLLTTVDKRPTAVLGISPVGIFNDGPAMGVPPSKRRFVTGATDTIASLAFGGPAPGWWEHVDPLVSEVDCGAEMQCVQPDGSGYVVLADEGHNVFAAVAQPNEDAIGPSTTIRSDWVAGQGKASFDWLASAARK